MATIWVLDTETKGTGANMVPLDRILRKPGSDAVPGFSLPDRKAPPHVVPEPRAPRLFKVVDIMTREVLADGADARATLGVLEDVHSIVDIDVYVWEPQAERWRMLTFAETKALWEYRGREREAGAQPSPTT